MFDALIECHSISDSFFLLMEVNQLSPLGCGSVVFNLVAATVQGQTSEYGAGEKLRPGLKEDTRGP